MPKEYLNKPAENTSLDPEEYIRRPAYCCGGGIVLIVLNLLVIYFYVRPAFIHRDKIPVCFHHREAIIRNIQSWIVSHPGSAPPTDLSVYRIPAHQLCPEEGVYSIIIGQGKAELHCSISDHQSFNSKALTVAYHKK